MFENLATFAYSNRRRVLFFAVLGTVIAGAFGAGVAKHMSPYGADDPATQSVQATNRFQAATGRQIDPGVVALVSSGDVRSAAARQRVEDVAAELSAQPDVASVQSFYTTHNPATVARDGRSTYVVAYFKALPDKRISDDAQLIESRFSSQPDVKLGGGAIANAQVNTQVGNDLAHAELIAFPFIFLLSLLFFRSVVAALLPPLLGGLAILGTFFLLRVVSTVTDLSVFALNLTTGLGLGLAIDYSLFIVARYREEAARDGFELRALRRTLRTAGRTVMFSSVTVALSVAALTIFPQRFLYSMGIAGAI
ncbi:MAG: MMPL family transporter, partial [Solirubrobacterales bacterium]|nr:MMPL family transporter [Solirubrobacterales bacterium]